LEWEYHQLLRSLRDEEAAEFWSVAVRVMLGTATSSEVHQIESLKKTNVKQWKKYQDAVEFIDGMAACHSLKRNRRIETMPPHIQKQLMKQLGFDEKPD